MFSPGKKSFRENKFGASQMVTHEKKEGGDYCERRRGWANEWLSVL